MGCQMVEKRKPVPISADVLLAYMTDKKVDVSCPRCPSTDWQMMETEDSRGVALSVLGGDGATTSNILPVVPLVCRNCGLLWPVARQKIEEWMAQREETGDVR